MMKDVNKNRAVFCPVCGKGRVIDAAAGTNPAQLRLYGPGQAEKAELFSKCPKCGVQVGISIEKEYTP